MTPDEEFEAAPAVSPDEEFERAPAVKQAPPVAPVAPADKPFDWSNLAAGSFGMPLEDPDSVPVPTPTEKAYSREKSLKALLAGLQGPANFLTDRVAGAKTAAQAAPQWFRGDLGHPLVDEYVRGRDAARSTVDDAVKAYPNAPLIGSLVTLPLNPTGASAVSRVVPAAYSAGVGGWGASRSDDQLGDALKAAGKGALFAGGLEVAGKGLSLASTAASNKMAAIEAAKKAKIAEQVEKEIAALEGKLGGETQVGHRYGENTQRAIAGVPETAAPIVSPELQQQAVALMASPEMKALQEKVLANQMAKTPGQLAKMQATEAELQALSGNKAQEIANRTDAYFAGPVTQDIAPRLDRLWTRAKLAGATAGLGAGLGSLTGSSTLTTASLAAGIGQVGAAGTIDILRNAARSPRIQWNAARGAGELARVGANLSQRAELPVAQLVGQRSSQPPTYAQELQALTSSPQNGPSLQPTSRRTPASAAPLALPEPYAAPQSPLWPPTAPTPFGQATPRAPLSPTNAKPSDTSEPEDEGVNALLFYGI